MPHNGFKNKTVKTNATKRLNPTMVDRGERERTRATKVINF